MGDEAGNEHRSETNKSDVILTGQSSYKKRESTKV